MRHKVAGVTFVSSGGELEQLLGGDGTTFLASTTRESTTGVPAYAQFKSAKAFAHFREYDCQSLEMGRFWQFSEVVRRAAPSRLAFAIRFDASDKLPYNDPERDPSLVDNSGFKKALNASLAAVNAFLREAGVDGAACSPADCGFARYVDKCVEVWRVVVRSDRGKPLALANQAARDAAHTAIRRHLVTGDEPDSDAVLDKISRAVLLDEFYAQDSNVQLVWSNDALEQGWVLRTLAASDVVSYLQTGEQPPRPNGRMTLENLIGHAVTVIPADATLVSVQATTSAAPAPPVPVNLNAYGDDAAALAAARRAGVDIDNIRFTDTRFTEAGRKLYGRPKADFVCPAGIAHGADACEVLLVICRGHVRFLCMGPPRGCATDLTELVRGKAVVRDGGGADGEAVEEKNQRHASRTGHEGACCDVYCGPLSEPLFRTDVVLRRALTDPSTGRPRYCQPPTVAERTALGVDPRACILVYTCNCGTGKTKAAIEAIIEYVRAVLAENRKPNVIYIASHVSLVTALVRKLTAAFRDANLAHVPWHDYERHKDRPDVLRNGCRVGCAMSISRLWAPNDDTEPPFVVGDEFAATLRMMPSLGTYALPLLTELFRKADVALVLDAGAGGSVRDFLEHAQVPPASVRWVRTDAESIFTHQTHRLVIPYRLNKEGGPKLDTADVALHIVRLLDNGMNVSVSCGKKFGAILHTVLERLGFKSLYLHAKLDPAEKKRIMTAFGELKRGDDSGVRAFIFTPAMVGGAESWGMFDVHVDALTLVTAALDWQQRVARPRDARAVDTIVADKRILWGLLPRFEAFRVERNCVYSNPDICTVVKDRTVMGAKTSNQGVGQLQLAALMGKDLPVTVPAPACDFTYVQSARAVYQMRLREPAPLCTLDDVRNAQHHVGRATATATRINGGTVEELSVGKLARAVRRSAFVATASCKDLPYERLLYGPKMDEANRAATIVQQLGEVAARIGVAMNRHAVNLAAHLTERDQAILDTFIRAKKSYNIKECIELARFALDRFLPFTGDANSHGALYKDADHRWEAMLSLWLKREVPDSPPPKRTRRAVGPSQAPTPRGPGPAAAPTATQDEAAAVVDAQLNVDGDEVADDAEDADHGDSDYESDDDADDEAVSNRHDSWQKTLWEMCLAFGEAMVRDLAEQTLAGEEAMDVEPEATPLGSQAWASKAWELATDHTFAQTFLALAKLKCRAQEGREQKVAERDAMSQRFASTDKPKGDAELRVALLDLLLETLGFENGVFDTGKVETLGDLRSDERADQKRIEIANAASAAYLGMVQKRIINAHDKQLMTRIVGAVKTLNVCNTELKAEGKGVEKRFYIARSFFMDRYMASDFAACSGEETPGTSWRTLRHKQFFKEIFTEKRERAEAEEEMLSY